VAGGRVVFGVADDGQVGRVRGLDLIRRPKMTVRGGGMKMEIDHNGSRVLRFWVLGSGSKVPGSKPQNPRTVEPENQSTLEPRTREP
jgi:hypothetical protein